jgi:hypothetical protein
MCQLCLTDYWPLHCWFDFSESKRQLDCSWDLFFSTVNVTCSYHKLFKKKVEREPDYLLAFEQLKLSAIKCQNVGNTNYRAPVAELA